MPIPGQVKVRIRVQSATGIVGMNIDNTSNVFFTVDVGRQTEKTKVIEDTNAPTYPSTDGPMVFETYIPTIATVKANNRVPFSSTLSDFLGQATLSILTPESRTVTLPLTHGGNVELANRAGSNGCGTVVLEYQVEDASGGTPPPVAAAPTPSTTTQETTAPGAPISPPKSKQAEDDVPSFLADMGASGTTTAPAAATIQPSSNPAPPVTPQPAAPTVSSPTVASPATPPPAATTTVPAAAAAAAAVVSQPAASPPPTTAAPTAGSSASRRGSVASPAAPVQPAVGGGSTTVLPSAPTTSAPTTSAPTTSAPPPVAAPPATTQPSVTTTLPMSPPPPVAATVPQPSVTRVAPSGPLPRAAAVVSPPRQKETAAPKTSASSSALRSSSRTGSRKPTGATSASRSASSQRQQVPSSVGQSRSRLGAVASNTTTTTMKQKAAHVNPHAFLGPSRPSDTGFSDTEAKLYLAAAIRGDRRPFVEYRLRDPLLRGPLLQLKDYAGRTVLHLAAWHDHVAVLDELLRPLSGSTPGIDWVKLLSNAGNTVLHCAACAGRVDALQYLVQQRGSHNMAPVRNRRGETPLEAAVAFTHLQAAHVLSRFGDSGRLAEDLHPAAL